MPEPAIVEGASLRVRAERPVHGGFCLAHASGRTLLVRHALPGELVVARVARVRRSVVEADVVEILEPSADRVPAPCPVAGPRGCGGCDLQHASVEAQLRWKAEVIADALRRQGRLTSSQVDALGIVVRPLPGGPLGWRGSARWHRDGAGRAGFRRWHEAGVVAVPECPVLAEPLRSAMREAREADRARLGSDGQVGVGSERTVQRVRDRQWRIAGRGFWQAHVHAASALVDLVLDRAEAAPGQRWWDLYAGAGLFSAFLGEAVGPGGSVLAIESSEDSLRDARRALHDLPQVELRCADAAQAPTISTGRVDGVVLDPPRTGAGEAVVEAIAASGAARVVAVSCDPVTFARDARMLGERGYRLERLDALDAFPMTHHVETVATFDRA